VNKSVEFCGLRGLQSLFLVDIQRASGEVVPAPAPKDIVLEGDVLSFSGQVTTVQNLLKVEGLSAAGIPRVCAALRACADPSEERPCLVVQSRTLDMAD
jgi:hypothetical protein